jgi:hypothetical protein
MRINSAGFASKPAACRATEGAREAKGEKDMLERIRKLALAGFVLAALPLVFSAPALAQEREFTGRIDSVSNRKMIVDNRMGDKLSFDRVDECVVEGEGKTAWDDLKKGDWVTVTWKLMDNPRKAYRVVAQPPRSEDDA